MSAEKNKVVDSAKANEEKKFADLLKRDQLKFTFERKLILTSIQDLEGHFDADSLYDGLKGEGHRISRDTVYRTLPLLLEAGVIQKSVGEGKREYYERIGNKGHHDHMICIKTGKVIEFHCEEIERLQDKIAKEHGFKIIFHDHKIFGLSREAQDSN